MVAAPRVRGGRVSRAFSRARWLDHTVAELVEATGRACRASLRQAQGPWRSVGRVRGVPWTKCSSDGVVGGRLLEAAAGLEGSAIRSLSLSKRREVSCVASL